MCNGFAKRGHILESGSGGMVLTFFLTVGQRGIVQMVFILNHPTPQHCVILEYCEQANKKNRCKSCLLRIHAGKTDSCTDSQRGLHWLHSTILCASLCITAAGPMLLCVYMLLLCSLSKLSLNTVNNTLCVYVLPVLAIAVLLMKYTFIVKRTL